LGIVINQSVKNLAFTYIGFAVGALNTLVFYQKFMTPQYYGLVNVLLSVAMIMYPTLSFVMSSGVNRFYPINKKKNQQGELLFVSLLFPLIISAIVAIFFYFFIDNINDVLSDKSILMKSYTGYIFLFGFFFGMFEVFYSISKVQLRSVLGNTLKEIFIRVIVSILLIALYFELITENDFIILLLISYGVRVVIMAYDALKPVYKDIKFKLPDNYREIISFSFFILMASSVLLLVFEIDKFMVSQMIDLSNVAYYSVATFVGIVVAAPGRSIHQILNPLFAREFADKNMAKVEELFKKGSLNLILISGYIFLLITLNSASIFSFLEGEYAGGERVTFYIGLANLVLMSAIGTNSIMSNSGYYKYDLLFGFLLFGLTISLNYLFIPIYGIDGAAMATATTLIIYTTLRLTLIWYLLKIHPFTKKSLKSILVIFLVYVFVNEFVVVDNEIVSILIRSSIITIVLAIYVYIFKPSDEVDGMLKSVISKIKDSLG